MERRDGVIASGLQPELDTVPVGKGAQCGFVCTAGCVHHAQYQHMDMLAHRHFDLRHAIADRQAAEQFGQQRQQRGDLRHQDLAMLHVGDETAALLVEADQRFALLDHVPDRKPCALAITPCLPRDWPHDGFSPDLADVPQALLEDALLDRDLRPSVQMLHRAAAAHAEMRAPRLHPHRGRLVYPRHLRQFERRLLAV